KLYVGGAFTTYDGTQQNRLARLNTDGTIDPTINFGAGANNFITSLQLQGTDRLYAGGAFTTMDNLVRGGVARLDIGTNSGAGSVEFSIVNTTTNGQPLF